MVPSSVSSTSTHGASSAQIAALVRDHAPLVRRALRQLGVAPAVLDDAVQDVLVVLVRRIEDFDPRRSLPNWLWGIAKGVASGYRRSHRRRSRLCDALADGAEPVRPTWAVALPCDAREVERRLAAQQAAEIVTTFLASLDADKCAVFVLSELEGHSGPEIATRLGVNVNTVYARLRAARRCFRAAAHAHRVPDGRPLFAGLFPSFGKSLSWAGAVTAAAAIAVPLPDAWQPAIVPRPVFVGYRMVPDAVAPLQQARRDAPAGADSTTVARRVRGSTALPTDEGAFAAALDFPFTGSSAAGQGSDRGNEPMLTTLVFASMLAAPATAPAPAAPPANDSDADAAAAVCPDPTIECREYIFTEDALEGEVLQSTGMNVLHLPRRSHQSLISIRGHFLPELIIMATDV